MSGAISKPWGNGPHQSDERVLWLVRQRAQGIDVTELSQITGKTTQFISTATNRVMREDMDHDPTVTQKDYWPAAKRGPKEYGKFRRGQSGQ